MRAIIKTFLFLFVIQANAQAYELQAEHLGGSVEAEINGKVVQFPSLRSDISADIQDDLVTVEITQEFINPTEEAMHARYLFPLNKDAAVYSMRMEVGDEIINAQIRKKEEAKQVFETAKKEGKAASLLTQHRPNMFTQKIANLMPGLPIKVTIKYTQTVPRVDGEYQLVIPMIVGPRYQPSGSGITPKIIDDGIEIGEEEVAADIPFGEWELESLPSYPEVAGLNIPDQIEKERVSLNINLASSMPASNIFSRTHDVNIDGHDTEKQITFQKGRVIDNRDFVLSYSLSGQRSQAGFLSSVQDGQGYFSLLIEPPKAPKEEDITAREMVFVLDTSGSMGGQPIEASKTFMEHALKNLRPSDYFRIIQFNNNAQEFTSYPLAATTDNLMKGFAYVKSLRASGGTEMQSGINQAFSAPPEKNTLRIVVFLTDGYIGNEHSILKNINHKISDARIYAFGVGTSVNRYLLSEMGRVGRGFARFIDPTEDMNDVAIQLAQKLETPVLTDISIDWGAMGVTDVTPKIIPDLFAGDSLRIQGKYHGRGKHTIRVHGKVQGHNATMPLQVVLSDEEESHAEAIPLIWARSMIADYMRQLSTPFSLREGGIGDDYLKDRVVELGLQFSLMTKWTSFVAVSEKVVNKSASETKEKNVPLPMVKGVSSSAYPSFSGGATPEPATTGGLIVIGGAALAALRRRRRSH